jgi:uncharacterized protein
MIKRVLEAPLRAAAEKMPAVALTGPRQSGKTTLCRATFPDHEYVSLEPLDVRDYAASDPRAFISEHPGPVIFDEVQRAPELFSYLQEEIDRDPGPGRYVLTGSQHFGLSDAISQSLAGRVAVLHLLPVSLDELRRFPTHPEQLWETVWAGGYPRIHDQDLDAGAWLADYTATYVERDVRRLLNVSDLEAFTTLLRLAAGRTAQELHLSSLGADAGVTHPTVRSWLSVLESSFVLFRTPRWHRNLLKRVVKAPKLHFIDSGLVCYLLGIRSPEQLRLHPLRGAIFESWVAAEVLKARLHRCRPADLYHFRETRGLEVDLIVESAEQVIAVEVRSAATVASDFFGNLSALAERADAIAPKRWDARLVYGGGRSQRRGDVQVIPWSEVQDVSWG